MIVPTLTVLCLSALWSTLAWSSPASSGSQLIVGNGADVATLDPHKAQGVPEGRVLRDMFEGLVRIDGHGQVIPGVAQHWSHKKHTIYHFHLRHDAKWSNGDPVTASDFVYSFRRAVDPKTASAYAWYVSLAHILNAEAIYRGKADPSTLGVSATDPHTLTITLDRPVPYFVEMLGHTTLLPVHQNTVTHYEQAWTKPEHMVSNGPFQIVNWTINEAINLTRNPYYWDNAHTRFDRVQYLSLEDATSEMFRFLTGEIDITSSIPVDQFERLTYERPDQIWVQPALCTEFYQFNTARAPFDDVRVRRALSLALDRELIAYKLLGQGRAPAYTFIPNYMSGYEEWTPPYALMTQDERDQKAQALLADAGYDHAHPLTFTLLYNTSDDIKKVAVAAAAMWQSTLGVRVKLENQEWKSYLSTMNQGEYDVARSAWCADYNEPSAMLAYLESDKLGGRQFADTHYDALVHQASLTQAADARREAYRLADAYLVETVPIIPIFYPVRAHLMAASLRGFGEDQAGPLSSQDLYRAPALSGESVPE
ncbi:peptide ABC transporter substrate-binding protein (plasmid) [Vibrio coralliilyticus OCN008]|jgi:oligopeptide transport system substrate-binding protein|nr:hypothetical protein N779_21230 [Vibrio coralliilyticus OCN008]QIJ87748.1 peptide ABC transporter substrate-binding protein [Vibrio coralliilyticus OCN008]